MLLCGIGCKCLFDYRIFLFELKITKVLVFVFGQYTVFANIHTIIENCI